MVVSRPSHRLILARRRCARQDRYRRLTSRGELLVRHQCEKAAQLGGAIDLVLEPTIGQDCLGLPQGFGCVPVHQERRGRPQPQLCSRPSGHRSFKQCKLDHLDRLTDAAGGYEGVDCPEWGVTIRVCHAAVASIVAVTDRW
jgi:hypothetical protein